ncbi:MAG: DUF3226 domain-containing protein [Crinalium sp.]
MPEPKQLLVEGVNDYHVISNLCKQHQILIPENFFLEAPKPKSDGINAILKKLPTTLKQENLRVLGIVVDADQDLAARWQSVRDKLTAFGYKDIPKTLPLEGWVDPQPNLPRIGVWVMPNNQLTGMLEDFVAYLIPEDDKLKQKAESILLEIEQDQLNRYTEIHRSKALIHTWLAWQKTPGMPMGQAITTKALCYDAAIAQTFIDWLKSLFELPTT